MYPDILVFLNQEWPAEIASLLFEVIIKNCNERGTCSVMLTGGRSARLIYNELSPLLIKRKERIDYYFSDERCVPENHNESNYNLVMSSLFTNGIPENSFVHKINGGTIDRVEEADRYASILPNKIDVLLLSIGEDGHIASLFPYDNFALEESKDVLLVDSPKEPRFRFTVGKKIILSGVNKYCICIGGEKGALLKKVFTDVDDILSMPARLVNQATWLLDDCAKDSFVNSKLI
jgi:6-phosphogluconolactonase